MSTTSSKVTARRRARDAKARADAQRRERDQRIEEVTTEYYLASDKLTDLRSQVAEAEAAARVPVVQLLDLGEPVDRVAELTDLSASQVRAIRRQERDNRPNDRSEDDRAQPRD